MENDNSKIMISDKTVGKLDKFHSYLTYFLAGSFFGLALGKTFDQFIGFNFPAYVVDNIDLNALYVAIGSFVSIICKVIFSLR